MKLHYLQHVPFEGLGLIADWAAARGIELSATHLFDGDGFPALNDFDLLVIMGGPMSVYDSADFPWLKGEMAFISRVLESGKPTLGICLGAQLIATVLGGEVTRNRHREIGWFPLMLEENLKGHGNPLAALGECSVVFHWHGETFSLPEETTLLAGSEACRNQAFVTGKNDQVLALQFHLETTPECVRGLIANAEDGELDEARFVQAPEEMLEAAQSISAILQTALYQILDDWAQRGAQH